MNFKSIKKAYSILVVLCLIAWVPVNFWLQRHDDALLQAVITADLAAANKAMAAGADIHMTIKKRSTLLQVAAKHHDNVAVAKFLVECGVSPSEINDDGDTALSLAEANGHERMAEFLMVQAPGSRDMNPKQAATGKPSEASRSPD